jgi:hypothetical protein
MRQKRLGSTGRSVVCHITANPFFVESFQDFGEQATIQLSRCIFVELETLNMGLAHVDDTIGTKLTNQLHDFSTPYEDQNFKGQV